jgi:hypothetical protein
MHSSLDEHLYEINYKMNFLCFEVKTIFALKFNS